MAVCRAYSACDRKLACCASAAEGRIALDQAIIAQLPQMIEAAANGLANANVTILNGADGLNDAIAKIATQGATILRTVSAGLSSTPAPPLDPAGEVEEDGQTYDGETDDDETDEDETYDDEDGEAEVSDVEQAVG
jgi:hypothetical protein